MPLRMHIKIIRSLEISCIPKALIFEYPSWGDESSIFGFLFVKKDNYSVDFFFQISNATSLISLNLV